MSQPSTCRCQEHKTPIHGYFYSMVELGVLKTFIDHHIFEAIPSEGSISVSELSDKVHGEYSLLKRFSNFLVAAKVLQAPSPDHLAHTPLSAMFQDYRATMFYSHFFEYFLVSAARWPSFFAENGLAEPASASRNPFGLAAGAPDKSLYEILETTPDKAEAFNRTMAISLDAMPITGMYDFGWVAEYAFAHSTAGQGGRCSGSRPLIVDVAGGMGQALKAILQENRMIPAQRCVLQDRPAVIEKAVEEGDSALEKVEKVGVSFLEEQPVKGALVYHIRRVLNDWPDEDCVKILSIVRAACSADSKVLVSEALLPEPPGIDIAAADIWMMNFGGKRRTESAYMQIASRAGLRVTGVFRHNASDSAILEMELA